jgi:hypothetical protein
MRNAAVPAERSAAPIQSIECCVRTVRRGIVRRITASATPPIGRFTRKTQRHVVLSTMNPPSAGPAMDAAANTAPKRPCHRPRSRGGTMFPITASDSGNRPPAPTPWIARKTTSSVIPCASPQSAEPIRKITIATTNRYFRP